MVGFWRTRFFRVTVAGVKSNWRHGSSDMDNSPDNDATDGNSDVDNKIGVSLTADETDSDND